MNHFSELPLCARLADNLAKNHFTQPTPVQAEAIPAALAGRDVVATAQTGTGKTLAFVLPLVERLLARGLSQGVAAVVLSPTRELAMQTSETFRIVAEGTGLRASVVVGGLSENPQLQAIRRGAQVLIATPGRLCDFLERRLVKLDKVNVLVLDEGDRMLDMGFQPDIERIVSQMTGERQTMFFSATIEAEGARLISKYLKDPVRVEIGSSTQPVDCVELHHYEMEQSEKLSVLEQLLSRSQGAFLVFARTRSRADKIATQLSAAGVKTVRIHGDRTQAQRSQALKQFQQGYCRVMVATDVAARGIHVDGIEHVVNFDLPQAPEDFIHRVGRTGRMGARGVASTFATRSERGEIRRIERTLKTRLTQKHAGRTPRAEVAADSAAALEKAVETVIAPVLRIDEVKAARPAVRFDRKPEPRGGRFEASDRRERPSGRPETAARRPEAGAGRNDGPPRRSSAPQWEYLTGPDAMKEDTVSAGRPMRPQGDAGKGPMGPFKPKWESKPRTESKAPAAGTFKPKWESRPRTDSQAPAAGSFRPKWEAKPKWEGKPNRDGRPARTFDNSTVGDYRPKWAAKSGDRQVSDARSASDGRPARRSAERPADFGPGPKPRKDPPWKNGPGMSADTRKPSWKGESSASPSRPALKGSSRKKVILKPAPRRNPGEAVFPWQGSGMSKLKRQA